MNLIVLSHRRSGTHLTIDTILNNTDLFSPCKSEKGYFTLRMQDPDEEVEQFSKLDFCIVKAHILPEFDIYKLSEKSVEKLKQLFEITPKIYVYRNGYDVMVSLYFYLKKFDEKVKNLSFSEFLRSETNLEPMEHLTPPKLWSYHIESWLASPILQKNTLLLSYEQWILDYENTLKKIFNFLQLSEPEKIIDVRMKNSVGKGLISFYISELKKKIKKLKGQKITSVLLRKGKLNEHKEIFLAQDYEYFNKIAGDTMQKLGYKLER